MALHRCQWYLTGTLYLVVSCSSPRVTTIPLSDEPLLGVQQYEAPVVEPDSGPNEVEATRLAELLIKARAAVQADQQNAAEQYFEEALDQISAYELQYGDLPQGHQEYGTLVDDILNEYRVFMQATVPYERMPYQPREHAETLPVEPRPETAAATVPGSLPPVPYTMNKDVETFLNYFQGRGRKWMRIYMERAGKYQPMVTEILRQEGMPDNLFYLAMIESGLSTTARSRAAACGMWQFIRSTGRVFGLQIDAYVDERLDPVKSTIAASHFLKNLYREYGHWYLAFSGYNGNKIHVTRSIARYKTRDFWKLKNGLRRETRSYVPKYIAAALIAENPEKYGFHDLKLQEPLQYETVTINDCVDLTVLGECAGTTYDAMRELNPELVRGYTPPDGKPYTLRIPAGTAGKFQQQLAALPDKYKVPKMIHVVQRGQTLSGIAGRYGLSVSDVMAANRLRNANRLSIGQTLTIPAPYRPANSQAPRRTSTYAASTTTSTTPPANYEKLTYKVRSGDSLDRIAKRFGVSINNLRGWNKIARGAYIYPNQRLAVYVPPSSKSSGNIMASNQQSGRTHVVRSGDTMWDIARLYGVSLTALMQKNGKSRRSRIHPGDRLTIPAVGE
jgi:membrane-bound lytic murein transglycosylase D